MIEHEAESSSQALERYLTDQLAALTLQVPQDDVEFMARFVEEEGMEDEDKVEGVKGMLEGVLNGDILPDDTDAVILRVIHEWERLREEDAERVRGAEADSAAPSAPPPQDHIKPELTEKEIAKAHAMKYAYLEGDLEEYIPEARPDGAPPRGGMAEAEAKKAAEEKKALLEAAIKLDSKKKKHRKQQEVDLLAPNLNREKVAYKAQLEREAQKKASQTVRDRDKAALERQRLSADAAKAKAEKQKKAAKQERRG